MRAGDWLILCKDFNSNNGESGFGSPKVVASCHFYFCTYRNVLPLPNDSRGPQRNAKIHTKNVGFSSMTSKVAIACFAFAVTCLAAVASAFVFAAACVAAVTGAVDTCVPSSPSTIIMHACTEVIKSSSFASDQKALAYKYRGDVRLQAGAVQLPLAASNDSLLLKKENARTFAYRGSARVIGGGL